MAGGRHRWMKFWPQDWQRDPALRCCGLAARGLWIEMICLMHEGHPYGHLTINGRKVTMKQLGMLTSVSEEVAASLVTELEDAGVLSRDGAGAIYSRRMVNDAKASDAGREAIAKRWSDKAGETSTDRGQHIDIPEDHPIRVPMAKPISPPNSLDTEYIHQESNPPIVPPAEGPTRSRRVGKLTRQVPADWQPDAAGVAYAEERGVSLSEVEKFRDYHLARGKPMADWSATWRTWCRNAQKFSAQSTTTSQADMFSDPWGINAWISRQADIEHDTHDGTPCRVINGLIVDHYAEQLAEAAGLPMSWRGNWDCLGKWLRDDMGQIDERPVLDAVRSQAQRMNGSIASIAVFDATVRSAAARSQRWHQ